MKLNKAELRKIMYDFNSISNRLLQADFQDYNAVLLKFTNFIKNNYLLYGYIESCGECEQDLETEFNEIAKSYGRAIFSLGSLDEEEVSNVFSILCYIVDKNIKVHHGVAIGYSASENYQDKVKGFNNRVVMVLIRHIERYLTKIGIDMGVDERINYSIKIENGQVNIANDNSTIKATITVNTIDVKKLNELIEDIKYNVNELSREDEETLASCLEVIKDESKSANPRKDIIKIAIKGLQTVKGSVELAAATATLIQFIQNIL